MTESELIKLVLQQKEEIQMLKQWNPLYKKRIYFLGSSWTFGSGCDGKYNFAMRIAERNCMEYINEAVSCTTYVVKEGCDDSYFERADRLPDTAPDYMLMQMSSNDPRITNAPIGEVTDFYDEDPKNGKVFDVTTIAGAYEGTISKLMHRYPGTKFAWYTGFKGPVEDSEEAQERMYAVENILINQISPKWGVPVCDLRRNLGLNTYVKGNRDLLTTGDAQHCIKAGYDAWVTALEAFLRSL